MTALEIRDFSPASSSRCHRDVMNYLRARGEAGTIKLTEPTQPTKPGVKPKKPSVGPAVNR